MKQKSLLISAVLILILVLGYIGRHQIKSMLGMNSQNSNTDQGSSTPFSISSTPSNISSNSIYLVKTDSTKGQYLTDFLGMTLYIFDKDKPGISNCSQNCASIWRPYTSGATSQSLMPANIATLKRSDGSLQFSWKGMPLYYYPSDQKTGDITGDGVGGIWHIARP